MLPLALLTIAQCAGPGCTAPAAVPVALPPGPPARFVAVVRTYRVRVNGHEIDLRGWRLPDGRIQPDGADPATVAAYRAAQARPAPRPKPAAPAAPRPPAESRPANYGLDPSKLFHGGPATRASSPRAERFLAETEAGGKLHLTVIGEDAERAAVMADLRSDPDLAPLASRAHVQEYRPGDWAVDPALGYPASGRPSILVQAPGGRVLWRAEDYRGGPRPLAEALRRADPDYKPSRDPGPDAPGPAAPAINWTAAAMVAALAFVLLLPRRR